MTYLEICSSTMRLDDPFDEQTSDRKKKIFAMTTFSADMLNLSHSHLRPGYRRVFPQIPCSFRFYLSLFLRWKHSF